MDWYKIDELTLGLAHDLQDEPEACKALMLLLQEIARHPSEGEGIANHANMRLFSVTVEADRAFDALMEKERAKL